MDSGLVKIVEITAVHGIKGEVKARFFVENPDYFVGSSVFYNAAGSKEFKLNITGVTKNSVIIRIEGVVDRNSAELLKGTELFVKNSDFPELEEGEFYYNRLIGLKVMTEIGNNTGRVVAVHDFGAGDILEIEFDSGETEMIPLLGDWVKEVNTRQGFIIISLPDYI